MTSLRVQVFLAGGGRPSGATSRLLNLASALRTLGHDVQLVAGDDGFVRDDARARAFVKHCPDIRRARSSVSRVVRALHPAATSVAAVRRHVAAFQPTVVVARNALLVPTVAEAAAEQGIPLLWDIGIELSTPIVRDVILARAARMAARIVVQSEYAIPLPPRLLRSPVIVAKLRAVLPGTDFRPLPRLSEGETASPMRIVQVGTYHSRKRQHVTLRALARCRDALGSLGIPSPRLTFIGSIADRRYHQQLLATVRSLALEDSVIVGDWTPLVAEILAQSDVFLLPSADEGVSNAAQEAMLAGCAVVLSDVGGARSIVPTPSEGCLVPADDSEALGDVLLRLASDPALRRDLQQAGRHFADQHFSTKSWARAYADVLNEVVS